MSTEWASSTQDSVLVTPSSPRHALPAAEEVLLQVELVEGLLDSLIDDVIDGLGQVVEGRHGREDYTASLGDLEHEPQVGAVERCLADDQHQLAALLELDV